MLNILVIIIVVHALIHLYGFINNRFLRASPQIAWKSIFYLSVQAEKNIGLLWLAAFLLFLISAISLVYGMLWWVIIAIVSIIISQLLIILYFKNIWISTIGNLMILAAIVWF